MNQAQIDVVGQRPGELLPAPADLDRLRKSSASAPGNQIHLMVAAWAWGAYLGEEGMQRGIRVKTSSFTRHHVNITMTQAKAVSNYSNSILANMEARTTATTRPCCSTPPASCPEGAGENIFVVRDGVVYTPDLSAGALNGITRNTVLHICQDLGLDPCKAHHARRGLHRRRGLLHRHGGRVTPIRELDRVQIGSAAAARSPRRSRARSLTSSRPQPQIRPHSPRSEPPMTEPTSNR